LELVYTQKIHRDVRVTKQNKTKQSKNFVFKRGNIYFFNVTVFKGKKGGGREYMKANKCHV